MPVTYALTVSSFDNTGSVFVYVVPPPPPPPKNFLPQYVKRTNSA